MITAFVGAGPGGKALMEMFLEERFRSFEAQVSAVLDLNPRAVGVELARENGIPVFDSLEELLALPRLELVFELTGNDNVLAQIHALLPAGVKVIDHEMARVFWELEESDRRFRSILNSVHGLVTVKDMEGRYVLANQAAAQFFGVPQDEFIGRTSEELLPPNVARLFSSSEREVVETGSRKTYKEEFSFAGRDRHFVSERFPVRDHKGLPVEICAVSRDTTTERHLQQELVQSTKLATLGQLAAGVAHELNNPLTGILSFAEDMKLDVPSDSPLQGDLDIIVRETMRCREIVRNLLDFARFSKPRPEKLSLNEVVRRVLTIIGKQAAFQDIEIREDLDDALPLIEMDASHFQQVILNLVVNAAEAMDGKGRIEIESSCDICNTHVALEIRDTGSGIPEKRLEQIFEPFFSTKGARGNGLGLPMVQRIVESHDGIITVRSTVGQGTAFRVEIPCNQCPQPRSLT